MKFHIDEEKLPTKLLVTFSKKISLYIDAIDDYNKNNI